MLFNLVFSILRGSFAVDGFGRSLHPNWVLIVFIHEPKKFLLSWVVGFLTVFVFFVLIQVFNLGVKVRKLVFFIQLGIFIDYLIVEKNIGRHLILEPGMIFDPDHELDHLL